MPKIRKRPEQVQQEATAAFEHEILMQRTDLGILQQDLAVTMGISEPTVTHMFKDVDKMPASRIRQLVQILSLNPITVLRWLGYTDRDIKKLKEE